MEIPSIQENTEYLFRIALRKCGNFHDAEDLTQEVLLAALQSQAEVRDLRSWMSIVLNHKYNDLLRKRYKLPTISIDIVPEAFELFEVEADDTRPTTVDVRREVAYLSEKYRQVIVRHYLGGQKVEVIAADLGIPKGTVLSRLSYGRRQMRKGLETMEPYEKQSYQPERLDVSCHGTPGFHDEPWSLVANDLMKQNILIVAYDTPVTVVEIAKALGIPTAYVENAVQDLTAAELMRAVGNKYHTDFMIVTPEVLCRGVDAEIAAVERHYAQIHGAIQHFLTELRQAEVCRALSSAKQTKLEFYFLLHLFSSAIYTASQVCVPSTEVYPPRPDGGRWIAVGTRYPLDFDFASYKFGQYTYGGERRAYREGFCNARSIDLHIYDMQPDLNRYEHGPVAMHDADLAGLLYLLSRGVPFEATGMDPMICENIPHLVDCGVLGSRNGDPYVNIPILTPMEYHGFDEMRIRHMHTMAEQLVPILRDLLWQVKIDLPKHLEGRVAEFRQYSCYAMPMAYIRSAVAKGDLHTDQGIPPMVFVVDDDNSHLR